VKIDTVFLKARILGPFWREKIQGFRRKSAPPYFKMFTSSRVWSDFGHISQQIRGFQIDYECGLVTDRLVPKSVKSYKNTE
jgi:hypothetical protein